MSETEGWAQIRDVAHARDQSLGAMLHRTSARFPTKAALVFGREVWTYADLDSQADRVARGLIAAGVKPGDRVAVISRNSTWFVALRFGVARAGAIFVPINFMLKPDEVAFILQNSGATFLFSDRECLHVAISAAGSASVRVVGLPDADEVDCEIGQLDELVEQAHHQDLTLPAVDGSGPAQILYTSGTESRPKGAVLTHDAIMWQVQSAIHGCDWRAEAVVINALPLFHCAQLDGFMAPSLHVGATNIILANPSPAAIVAAVREHGATSLFCPPTVWIDLLRHIGADGSALATLTHGYYGASIMPVEVLRELAAKLPNMRLWNCYGQTEIACIATLLHPEDQMRKPGSAGRPVLHVETRIVDDEMKPVGHGELGEVVHRSPQLMSYYWSDPERTAAAFAGGWFHTGDLATMDAEGFITIVDRKKDMIKTGGENVSSREVEEVLYMLPGVSEAAVIGLPDPRWIEAVTAVIVSRKGESVSEGEVLAACRRQLAGFKVPKRILFVDQLPRNASGKILKRELRLNLMEGGVMQGPIENAPQTGGNLQKPRSCSVAAKAQQMTTD